MFHWLQEPVFVLVWWYDCWFLASKFHLLVEVLKDLDQMVWSHEVNDADSDEHLFLVDDQQQGVINNLDIT